MDQPPDGMRSYLVASIEEAVASVDGSPIAGVIVLTDGVTQERPLDLEQRIAALDVPAFFLAPGKGSGRDIALSLAGEARSPLSATPAPSGWRSQGVGSMASRR